MGGTQRADEGEPAATEELVPLVYEELRALARRYFRQQRPGLTLRPTEIVHEACLHLMQHARGQWQSPQHFRAVATKKIWQVIIDHLRRRRARKRGGPQRRRPDDDGSPRTGVEAWQRVPLDSITVDWRDRAVDLLDLAEALEALAAESRRPSEVVMLHWFGGLTYAEAAGVLGVSASTVEKDFRYALAWLNRRLAGTGAHAD